MLQYYYRTIFVLSKVFGHVLYQMFFGYIEKFHLVNENQFNFKKKHKRINALTCAIQQVRQSMDKIVHEFLLPFWIKRMGP